MHPKIALHKLLYVSEPTCDIFNLIISSFQLYTELFLLEGLHFKIKGKRKIHRNVFKPLSTVIWIYIVFGIQSCWRKWYSFHLPV